MQSDIVQRLQPILRRNGWGNVQEYARHIPFMLEREGLTIVESAEITRLTEALRAAEEREKGLREVAIKLHGALAEHTREGCPRCPGDCAGANPPMMDCPTQLAIEAYRAFDAALKGPSHDA